MGMKTQTWTSLVGSAAALALLASPALGQAATPKTYEVLNLFGDAFDRVRGAYVEEIADEQLIGAAINGMLAALDPLSRFLTPDEYDAIQSRDSRTYDSLGLEITMDGGVAMIIAAIDGSPGDRLGLRPGDLIIEVSSTPVFGMTLNEAIEIMQGEPGTMVDLTMVREGADPFLASMIRETVAEPSLSFRTEGVGGYVRIPFFTDDTGADLTAAVTEMTADLGGALEGVILDLRDTPGGLFESAITVADLFLDGGDIVTAQGKTEADAQLFSATAGDIGGGLPLVVLIDGGSAAASEIVAGALKDNGRAILLGETTFGKGSAQTIVPMGDFGYVELTTSYYYTPSGRSIDDEGIAPEIVVEPALVIVEQRNFPRRTEADLRGALDVPAQDDQAAAAEEEIEEAAPDYQLARAFDLLHALALVSKFADAH